mmetsp:Transcript_27533/g.59813  ORF Transcript_27533/g.59813 Transcript_27533/m.59813 type:complete len:238 (+) Transcript_27533:497-1210(+)
MMVVMGFLSSRSLLSHDCSTRCLLALYESGRGRCSSVCCATDSGPLVLAVTVAAVVVVVAAMIVVVADGGLDVVAAATFVGSLTVECIADAHMAAEIAQSALTLRGAVVVVVAAAVVVAVVVDAAAVVVIGVVALGKCSNGAPAVATSVCGAVAVAGVTVVVTVVVAAAIVVVAAIRSAQCCAMRCLQERGGVVVGDGEPRGAEIFLARASRKQRGTVPSRAWRIAQPSSKSGENLV